MIAVAARDQATVGFVGLGNMGWPMARNLARAGTRLIVHDAAPGRADAFAEEVGGQAAGTLAALAERAAVVITMLPDGDAVRDAVTGGPSCLLEGMVEGCVLIDMGSSDPRIYQDLAPALEGCGAHLIDAPVSGGVKGAFALPLMARDLATALGLAHSTGTPAALSAQVLEITQRALDALGPAADHTALARYFEAEVGEELYPRDRPDQG